MSFQGVSGVVLPKGERVLSVSWLSATMERSL